MMKLKSVAVGAVVAGALGLGALGIGAGVANAAPGSPVTSGAGFAQDWDGHGHGWGGPGPGPGWGGPGPGWGDPGWAPGPMQALGIAGNNAEQQLGQAGYGVLNGIGCLLGGC